MRTGGGDSIANGTAVDVPAPGGGLNTVTAAVPTVSRSLAGMVARSCVAFTYVVALAAPFHWTIADGVKLSPVTVRVRAALPTSALLGESAASTFWPLPRASHRLSATSTLVPSTVSTAFGMPSLS